MTRDDIIRMAREAWISDKEAEMISEFDGYLSCTYLEDLERFAQLVAAHTLANIDPSKFMSYQEGYETGVTTEREACAKVCEKYADVLDPLRPEGVAADYFQGGVKSASRRNASAIRARGQQ